MKVQEDIRSNMIESIPVKRAGKPEDVAYVMKFLASEQASYITGQTLQVNGGLNM